MLSAREMVWLHSLQEDLAAKRDWVSVAHLQCLIDRIADEHPVALSLTQAQEHEIILH